MQKTSASSIIDHAVDLFRAQGYRSTSMKDIADACGLLKGSIYHHFDSKEDILFAATARVGDDFGEGIFSLAYDEAVPPAERLHAVIDLIEQYFLDHRACLMAHLGLEGIREVPNFENLIRHFFTTWAKALAHLLTPTHGHARANRLAVDTVVRIEGAVMWLRILGDDAALRRACEDARRLTD